MASKSDLYRRLWRLRQKEKRLRRRIKVLEGKIARSNSNGQVKAENWGNCGYRSKRHGNK